MKRSVRPKGAVGTRKVRPTLAKVPGHFSTGERFGDSTNDHCDGATKAELVINDIEENAELSLPKNATKPRFTATSDGPDIGDGEPMCNVIGSSPPESGDGLEMKTPRTIKETPADVGHALALPKTPQTDYDERTARWLMASPSEFSPPTPISWDPPIARIPSAGEMPSRQQTPVNKRPLMAAMQPGCRSHAENIDRYRKPRGNHDRVLTLELQNRAKVQNYN